LDELERLKAAKTKLTVISFCKHVGYANKSALRRFLVLRRELTLYTAEFAGSNQKRIPPSALKYFEVQIERQNRIIDRLKGKVSLIPKLNAKIAKLDSKAKSDAEEKRKLRGMLSTVIALLSGSDFAKARDLSTRLERLVSGLLEED